MSSENYKILLDYKSERNIAKPCLNRACFTVLRSKLWICDKQYEPPIVNYMPTARQCEIQNSMFGTPVGQVGCYFPVQNMVRVIKGKII